VPDLDNIRHFENTAPGEIDVSIRAVGEILPNPQNNMSVPMAPGQADLDQVLVPRATETLVPRRSAGNNLDSQVMNLMNQGIDFLVDENRGPASAGFAGKSRSRLNARVMNHVYRCYAVA
jgi:hypothetical protein